jgi:hypothetical protein
MMFLEKQDNEHRVDMERNPHVEEYDLETTE